MHNPMIDLAAFDEDSGHVNAIIDTPKGSRNKYKYDEKLGIFKLAGALPLGAVFAFDFGYIPSTRASSTACSTGQSVLLSKPTRLSSDR
jgi:inorganic pyrophosphatase